MPAPLVTIAIACRNEEGRIRDLVRAALEQDWPTERLEVVVADGMSMDSTREILGEMAIADARVRLLDNPHGTRAAGLNECIRHAAKGSELVIRFDAGAEYPADFVRRCAEALDRSGADNVAGAARPRGKTFLQRCVAAALRSPLGIGGWGKATPADRGWVDGVRPGAFRRGVFERIGLFDPRAAADEDVELGRRIAAAGGRIEQSEDVGADYYPAQSLQGLARKSFGYGLGRARTMLKHGRFSSWGPTLPLLWLVGEIALIAASPRRALPWSLAGYALATGAEAVRVGRSEGALAVPVVWALFPVLHVAHGVGFASGLAKYVVKPDWETAERLEPETVSSTATAST